MAASLMLLSLAVLTSERPLLRRQQELAIPNALLRKLAMAPALSART